MKTKKLFFITFAAIAFLIQSCVSEPKINLDQKISKEPVHLKRSDLVAEGESLIEKSPNLTADQRAQLRALWSNLQKQLSALEQTSLKLRSVLIEVVISTNYKATEVKFIEKKIAKVEEARLKVFLDGVFATNHILERWGSAAERDNFYHWFTIDTSSHIF